MEPQNTNLDRNSTDPVYGDSLEAGAPVTPLLQPSDPRARQSLFRYNRQAFLLTSVTVVVIILIAVTSLFLSNLHNGKKSSQSAGLSASNYAVTSLPLGSVKASDNLQLGGANQLVINGQLRVSNSLVLAPQALPANPTAGQIYFDQTAKVPYYYNGSQFMGLATDQSLAAIAANRGIVAVQGTTGQVNATNVNGVVTLSLPTAIATGSYIQNGITPQTADFNITGNGVIGGSLDVVGVITGNGVGLSNVNAAQLNGQNGSYYTNATNLSSGTVADARLSNDVALLNGTGPQTFTGNNKFTGTILTQNSTDSTTAFQIQNAAGTSNLLVADTTDTRVGIGTAAPVTTLTVKGAIQQSGMYTPTTSNSNYNEWTELGNCSLTIRYVGCTTDIKIIGGENGNSPSNMQADVYFEVYQQNAMGSAPAVVVNVGSNVEQITASDVVAVTTTNSGSNTTVQLWVYMPNANERYGYTPIIVNNGITNGTIAWTPNTALQASLPAGTQTVGTYNDVNANTIAVSTLGTANTVSYLCRNSSNIVSTCQTNATGSAFVQGGNSFGATAALGTNDNNSLTFKTNNITQATIAVGGATTFQNSTNSTTAFQVQNAAGSQLLAVDSTSDSTNLITNGSFDQNTTGWSAKGSATLSSDSTYAEFGSASMKIATTTAAGDGAEYPITLSPNTMYSFSLYVMSSSTGTFEMGRSDNGSTDTSCNTDSTATTGWVYENCSFTTGSSISSSYIYIKQTDTTARNFWVDGVHLYASSSGSGTYNQSRITLNGTIVSPLVLQPSINTTNALQINSAGGGQLANFDTLYWNFSFYGNAYLLKGSSTDELSVGNNYSDKALIVDTTNTRVGINIGGATNTLNVNGVTTADSAAQVLIGTNGTTNKGLVIQGVTSQSANLFEAQTSAGSSTGIVTSIGATGQALFQNSTNSTTAFQVQNALGNQVLTVDTTVGQVALGKASGINGQLLFDNATNANTITLVSGATTGSYSLTLPTAGPAVSQCLQTDSVTASQLKFASCGSSSSGVTTVGTIDTNGASTNGATISGSSIFMQSASATNPGLVNTTTQTLAGAKTFTGASLFQNSADSTTAFQVQNALGNQVLTVDTSGTQVVLGKASTLSGKLEFFNAGGAGNIALQAANPGASTYTITLPAETGTVCTTGSVCAGYSASSGSGNYIQNQNAGAQAAANFWISGTGRADTSVQTPLLDTATAVGLAIGTTNASGITVGSATNIGTLTFGQATTGETINIGNGNVATGKTNTINIGATATSTGKDAITIGSTVAASSLLLQAGTGNLQIQSQGGTLGVGNNAVAQTINIGNTTGATALNLLTGTGNFSLDGVAGSTYALGASTTTGTITIGGTAQTGNLTLGSSSGTNNVLIANGSGASTVNIANVQAAGAVNLGAGMTTGTITIGGTGLQTGTIAIGTGTGVQTINLATGGTGAKTVTLGSTASAGATTIQAGTGGVNIGTGGIANTIQIGTTTGAVAQTVNIGNNTTASSTSTVVIGNLLGTSPVTLQAGTSGVLVKPANSTTAFQVQNATSTSFFTVDTSGSTVNIGITGSTAASSHIHIADTSGNSTQTVSIGSNGNTSSTLTLDAGTGATAIQIGNSATAHGIQIGTGAAVQTITLGSTNTTSTTTIQSGTGNINLSPGGSTGGVIVKPGTDNTAAFQIQDASANTIVGVSTLNQYAGTETAATINVTGAVQQTGFITPYTSGSGAGEWTELGYCTITVQFTGCATEIKIVGGLTGASPANTQADVYLEAYQQAAFGSAPAVVVNLGSNAEKVTASNFIAEITTSGSNSIVQLWAQMPNSYETWHYTPMLTDGDPNITWTPNTALQASPTAGNQTSPTTTYNDLTGGSLTIQNAAGTALLTTDTTNLKVTTIGDVNVGNRYGNRLFSDNFESGGFGLWSGGVTGSATTVQTTTVHAGKYAAEFNPSGSVNYVSTSLNSSNATKYVRFWANVTSATTSADFAEFYAGATQLANVYYQQSTSKICIYNQVSATTAGCTASSVSSGTGWHQVEMQATVATSTTGTLALWVDGVQAFTSSTQNLGTVNIDSLDVGENASGNTNTFFIDDLSVDTVSNGTASSLNVDDSLHVGGTSTFGNSVLIQPATNSTTAFQVQNAAGTTLFSADTSNSRIGIGTNAPEVGLQVSEANYSSTLPFNTLLTDTTATAQGVGGGIGFSGKIDGTTTDYTFGAIQGYKENGTTSNDAGALHFLTRPNGGNLTQVLSLGSNGAATFQNSTNSTTAFQVQNSGGTNLLSADTTNGTIQVGSQTANTNTALLSLNNYSNGTTEPTVINGAIYYNSALNAFRCGLNSVWVSCIGGLRYANTDQSSLPAGDTLTNTTTATALAENYTIPANDCVKGRVYRVVAQGTYSDSVSDTLLFKVQLGTTVVATNPGTPPTTSGNVFTWNATTYITCTTSPAASALIEANGTINAIAASTGSSSWWFAPLANQAASVNTTASQTVQFVLQWGTASTSASITLRQLTVEALGP